MHGTDKGKAKTLATASTLQKVVCPAPERDPQEILSYGWRKVGEQKRVTNRLANGHPDRGVGVSSREPSFKENPGHRNRQTGRQVLDKMFGHMRPHHILMPTAVLSNEDRELENGLGCQAARVAFFRPAIGPALNGLAPITQSFSAPAEGGAGATKGVGASSSVTIAGAAVLPSSPRRIDGSGDCHSMPLLKERGAGSYPDAVGIDVLQSDEGGSDSSQPLMQLGAHGSSPQGSLRRHGATATAAAAAAQLFRHEDSPRPADSGGASPHYKENGSGGGGVNGNGTSVTFGLTGGHGSSPRAAAFERRGALPSVIRSYPSDSGITAAGLLPTPSTESARLPAAVGAVASGGGGPAAAGSAASPKRRRASISGDTALPAIGSSGHSSVNSHSSGGVNGNGSKTQTGRARRASMAGSDIPVVPAAALSAPRRASITGADVPSGCGSMPQLVQTSHVGAPHGAGRGPSPLKAIGRSGVGVGGSVAVIRADVEDSPNSPVLAPIRSTQGAAAATTTPAVTVAVAASGTSPSDHVNPGAIPRAGGSLDAHSTPAQTQLEVPIPVADLVQSTGGPTAGGSMGSPGSVVNPAVPLSGLENLATTGLGDAILQLRNIRMVNGSAPPKDSKERKQEPGLAGLVAVQLLPVALPPLDNWQLGNKQSLELDPCKGIRLVDTASYVLPRAAAEACLQVRMAQHQAAMRELVKAEGAPMSEMEMEAAKLLGRLERSGARHRNFDTMDSVGTSKERAEEEDVE